MAYTNDLAHIHDQGYSHTALAAAAFVNMTLALRSLEKAMIVDLVLRELSKRSLWRDYFLTRQGTRKDNSGTM